MVNNDLYNGHQHRLADYAGLASLQIPEAHLAALARQGRISCEHRQSSVFFKLRYRVGGRQRVRYIGDGLRAGVIREELIALQSGRRQELELRRLASHARRVLRESKEKLRPIIEANKLKFHGYALRRPRNASIA